MASVSESIAEAMEELKGVPEQEEIEPDEPAEKEAEKTSDDGEPVTDAAPQEPEPQEPEIAPPNSWSGLAKEEWSKLPRQIKEQIAKREDEVHKGFTKQDEERSFGKSLKSVIDPYMPIITAEGGTPEGAVKGLLNTAYLLRTGSPQQKAALMHRVIQQYGVDLRLADPRVMAQPQQQPIDINKAVQEAIARQQDSENEQKIQQEITAFAADPKNIYFNDVRALMGPLLESGQAGSLQEAYDMACRAHPKISSSMQAQAEAQAKAEAEKKRKSDVAKKKEAGASLSGSPSVANANPAARPKGRSVEEDIAETLAELRQTGKV